MLENQHYIPYIWYWCLVLALYSHHLPTLHPFRWKHDRSKHGWLAVRLQQPVPCLGLQGLWYRGACVWIRGQNKHYYLKCKMNGFLLASDLFWSYLCWNCCDFHLLCSALRSWGSIVNLSQCVQFRSIMYLQWCHQLTHSCESDSFAEVVGKYSHCAK